MKDGIPNLSTPADLFDRLIIERLKVEKIKENTEAGNKATFDAEQCVRALKTEINKEMTQFVSNYKELTDLFDNLVCAVSMVSFCENSKADLHKKSPVPINAIVELDRISRKANEDRSRVKREINKLFELVTGNSSLTESRTF